MAEGGMNGGNCLGPFSVNFWPPRGVGVQNPLLAIKSIYLLFCLHPLYLLFLFGGLWAPEMNAFFLGFEDFDTIKG
jgi:hypothetical protein